MKTQSGNSFSFVVLIASIAVLLYCGLGVAAIVNWSPAAPGNVEEAANASILVSACIVCDAIEKN